MDRWYLTPEVPSASGVGLCDFLSYWFVGIGQAAIALAIAGSSAWVWFAVFIPLAAFPFAYFLRMAEHAPLGVLAILVAVLFIPFINGLSSPMTLTNSGTLHPAYDKVPAATPVHPDHQGLAVSHQP